MINAKSNRSDYNPGNFAPTNGIFYIPYVPKISKTTSPIICKPSWSCVLTTWYARCMILWALGHDITYAVTFVINHFMILRSSGQWSTHSVFWSIKYVDCDNMHWQLVFCYISQLIKLPLPITSTDYIMSLIFYWMVTWTKVSCHCLHSYWPKVIGCMRWKWISQTAVHSNLAIRCSPPCYSFF